MTPESRPTLTLLAVLVCAGAVISTLHGQGAPEGSDTEDGNPLDNTFLISSGQICSFSTTSACEARSEWFVLCEVEKPEGQDEWEDCYELQVNAGNLELYVGQFCDVDPWVGAWADQFIEWCYGASCWAGGQCL